MLFEKFYIVSGPSTLMNYHDDSTTVAFAEAVLGNINNIFSKRLVLLRRH